MIPYLNNFSNMKFEDRKLEVHMPLLLKQMTKHQFSVSMEGVSLANKHEFFYSFFLSHSFLKVSILGNMRKSLLWNGNNLFLQNHKIEVSPLIKLWRGNFQKITVQIRNPHPHPPNFYDFNWKNTYSVSYAILYV